MKLFDTHCHIDLYPDYQVLIAEIEKAQITTIAVTTTPSVFRQSAALVEHCQFISPALGLHPELAVQRQRELPLLLELLPHTRFVGEIGLDYVTSDAAQRRIQNEVFERIVAGCAQEGDKVLTVHSRRAAAEVVERIGDGFPGTVILHWFSGSLKVVSKALDYGFYFSVNSAMFASESGKRIIAALPFDRVLTETDGPFVIFDGRPVRPSNVESVVINLANLWHKEKEQVAEQIEHNFQAALSIWTSRFEKLHS